MTTSLIYEVECQLDPDIVAAYDAWLPGHVRDVLACAGFRGASTENPETPPGEPARRLNCGTVIEGRQFFPLPAISCRLLGITMMIGFVFAVLSLS